MTLTSVIIGANSFLGQEIISKELLLKNNVLGVYHKNKDKLLQKTTYYSLEEFFLLEQTIDIIYLVSAYVPDGDVNQENLFKVNVKLVKDVSSLFPNTKIVLASSVSVYETTKNIITEKSTVSPINTYGISKLWAEHILKEHKNHSIVRISSMYGIGMKINTFIPRIILSAIKKDGKIVLFGDGGRLQNYVHVSHVAKVMVKAAYIKSNHVYLAVDNESISNKELAILVKENSSKVTIEYTGIDNSPSFTYNDNITKAILEIDNKVSLEKEIKNLWSWLKRF
jgi:nucleoside-diphosphate-sugar epimerase